MEQNIEDTKIQSPESICIIHYTTWYNAKSLVLKTASLSKCRQSSRKQLEYNRQLESKEVFIISNIYIEISLKGNILKMVL